MKKLLIAFAAAAAVTMAGLCAPVAQATPVQDCVNAAYATNDAAAAQRCMDQTRSVWVQNPDDPKGPPMQMTREEATQIASGNGSPQSGQQNDPWVLKPAPSLLDQINQGAGNVNRARGSIRTVASSRTSRVSAC
jgi:hypothetical protein